MGLLDSIKNIMSIPEEDEFDEEFDEEDMEEYKRKLAAEDERIAQEMERLESEAVVKKEKAKKELDEIWNDKKNQEIKLAILSEIKSK